jgi:hypothetical protein
MEETWLPVNGFEGLYEVSSLGRVRGKARVVDYVTKHGQRVSRRLRGGLKRHRVNAGYCYVRLCLNGKMGNFLVHRLVAEAFLVQGEGKDQVNHINFDGTDNRIENLEWCTRSENQKHSVKHGRGAYGKDGWKVQSRVKARNSSVADQE